MYGIRVDSPTTTPNGTSAQARIDSKQRLIVVGDATAPVTSVPYGSDYETVAASQTAQVLGATGATGDYLSHVILQPATVGAGAVTILDNATVIYTFTTGTLSDLRPITVPIGAYSVSGAWKVTTGTNVAVLAVGEFT